jgi:hypothetical protein
MRLTSSIALLKMDACSRKARPMDRPSHLTAIRRAKFKIPLLPPFSVRASPVGRLTHDPRSTRTL